MVDDNQAVSLGGHAKEGGPPVEQLGGAQLGPRPDGKASNDTGDDANGNIFDDRWG